MHENGYHTEPEKDRRSALIVLHFLRCLLPPQCLSTINICLPQIRDDVGNSRYAKIRAVLQGCSVVTTFLVRMLQCKHIHTCKHTYLQELHTDVYIIYTCTFPIIQGSFNTSWCS